MQTFLPYPNFIGSAQVLDRRRLGKQRVENIQIMQALLGKRLAHTSRFEPTGEYRDAYFDEDDNEIPIYGSDPFTYAYKLSVPMTRIVDVPRAEWTVKDQEPAGWANHPVLGMWRGSERVLLQYQNAICDEWTSRGYRDSCKEKMQFLVDNSGLPEDGIFPDWIGDEDFHRSHQSNLVRKNPEYYRQYFPDVPDDLPYIWPVNGGSREKQGL